MQTQNARKMRAFDLSTFFFRVQHQTLTEFVKTRKGRGKQSRETVPVQQQKFEVPKESDAVGDCTNKSIHVQIKEP